MQHQRSIENVLIAGYCREHEDNQDCRVPSLVVNVIATLYPKIYIMHSNAGESSQTSTLQQPVITTENIDNADIDIVDRKHGKDHSLLLSSTGHVYAVGSNDSSQCGVNNDIHHFDEPTLVQFEMAEDIKVKAIAAGKLHSLFLDEDDQLIVCGFGYSGQLGIDFKENEVGTDSDCCDIDIDNMDMHSCCDYSLQYSETDYIDDECGAEADVVDEVYTTDQGFAMIDSDDDDDDDADELVEDIHVQSAIYNPYFEALGTKFSKIECGNFHSVCLTTKGECYTFGQNDFGNLGNGLSTPWGPGLLSCVNCC